MGLSLACYLIGCTVEINRWHCELISLLETSIYFGSKCVVPEYIHTHPRGLKAKIVNKESINQNWNFKQNGARLMSGIWTLLGSLPHIAYLRPDRKIMLWNTVGCLECSFS